jgi:hypothetical protein
MAGRRVATSLPPPPLPPTTAGREEDDVHGDAGRQNENGSGPERFRFLDAGMNHVYDSCLRYLSKPFFAFRICGLITASIVVKLPFKFRCLGWQEKTKTKIFFLSKRFKPGFP